ncbi:hypothetical protein I7I48_06435 [Histoplasma ohiense]|nr:hypothetical protein I7I48_06435 [Histoplasma ohiense (nom. inval.)]
MLKWPSLSASAQGDYCRYSPSIAMIYLMSLSVRLLGQKCSITTSAMLVVEGTNQSKPPTLSYYIRQQPWS